MPSRNYTAGNSYRYSINGQEKTPEIAPNTTTALYWEYDARIGRRWNVDPVTKDDESPYLTFGGNPVVMVDPNGDDWYKNKKTHNVDWIDCSGKQKGYRHLGVNFWSKTNTDSRVWYGNSKEQEWQYKDLDDVVVTGHTTKKEKKEGHLQFMYWPNYTHQDVDRFNTYHALLRDRHTYNLPLVQNNDPQEYKDNFNFYQRAWQANQDWREMEYQTLNFASLWVPVPKLGMLRWLKNPLGTAGGRVFWSGGGYGGKAWLAATAHAIETGGTTLEMTTVGKVLTKVNFLPRSITGKLWGGASWLYARGATNANGSIKSFLYVERLSTQSFWLNIERPILESRSIDFIEKVIH